jgi:hypothetical protein
VIYKDSKGNYYPIRSELASYNRSVVRFKWNAAVPYTFRPGYRILIHYDGEDETNRDITSTTGSNPMYKTKSGIINAVEYSFTVEKIGDPIFYFCQADIAASIEVDKSHHTETII